MFLAQVGASKRHSHTAGTLATEMHIKCTVDDSHATMRPHFTSRFTVYSVIYLVEPRQLPSSSYADLRKSGDAVMVGAIMPSLQRRYPWSPSIGSSTRALLRLVDHGLNQRL